MGDFDELKKRVDVFLKDVKGFVSELKGSDDEEKHKQRYIELRNMKNAFSKEVNDFEPAKKIIRLDSKKSSMLKSLQSEIVKAEKAMTKQKIEVPIIEEEDEEEEEENSTEKKNETKEDEMDEGKGKGKKDKKKSSFKEKLGKKAKKGKSKVEVIDDDRKSTSSAKGKQVGDKVDNEFEDTDEEEDQDEGADAGEEDVDVDKQNGMFEEEEEEESEEEDEDVADDKISTTSKGKAGSKTKKKDKKADAKAEKKSKDKKKDKVKGDKKSRKDSEKSLADDKESKKVEQKDAKDGKKSSKSKEDKKGKKSKKEVEQKSKSSKKEKASKDDKKSKKAKNEKEEDEEVEDEEVEDEEVEDEEVEEEEEQEDEAEQNGDEKAKKDKKKDKRKSKEIKEPKEDKTAKKEKRKSKEIKESKEDINTKDTEKEDKKDESKKTKMPEEKTAETKEVVTIHQEPKERMQASATSQSARVLAAEDDDEEEEDDGESEYDDQTENNFEEETEDEDDPVDQLVSEQAPGVQSSPAATAPTPTPAPRQKAAAGPATQAPVVHIQAPAQVAEQLEIDSEEGEEDGDFEDEEEEEESEYDYENMRTLGVNEANLYVVLQSYTDNDPDMMNIHQGEQLRVLKIGPDGWYLARNTQGHEGLVPSTLLRLVHEDEDEDEEDFTQADTTGDPQDFSRTGPTEGDDESEYEADDLGEDDRDAEVVVSAALSLSQRMVTQTQPTPPGVPAGFRVSSLAKWFYEGTKTYPGRQFTLQSMLQPKLTSSCMSLQDGWGCTPQTRPVSSRIEKLIHLQKCQMMPTGLPVKVLDRFVRFCLFDGHGPVSNVHTVRATVAKDDRVWTFGSRVTDTGSVLDYGEAYLRYNYAPNHVRLLLEATIVCQSETTGAEAKELSIGHAVVPLFDETGGPMPAKAFDLQFEGGTPFEHHLEVDPNLGQSGTQKRSQPRIQLKLSVPNRETKEFMDTCPSTTLGNLAHLQLHSLYRHVLASELMCSNRVLEQRASPIYAPHLVQFPAMADQPDLMDVIRRRWNDFAKRDRAFKKPVTSEVMKQEFIRIVKSTYFLNQLKDFQPYVFGNKAQEQMRANVIQDFLRKIATDQSAVNFSLSADLTFEPFSMEEVALPIIGPYSVPVQPVAVE